MTTPDDMLRFVAQRRLAHLDSGILQFLLDHPRFTAGRESAQMMLAKVLDPFFDDDEGDPDGWTSRIASLAIDDDEDEALAGQCATSSVPPALRAEFELAFEQVAEELMTLRQLSEQDLNRAYTASCEEHLQQTTDFPEPEWELWRSYPKWDIEETAALLFGKDPTVLRLSSKNLPPWARSAIQTKINLLQRHINAASLREPMGWLAVSRWVKKHQVNAPFELIELRPGKELDSEKLHHHTEDAFHKTLVYLAVVYYGYEVDNFAPGVIAQRDEGGVGNNSVAGRMARDMQAAGVGVGKQTIWKHLKAATDAIKTGHRAVDLEKLAKRAKTVKAK